MTELVWMDQGMTQGPAAGSALELDLCEVGIIVLDDRGRVASSNTQARALLRAESQFELADGMRDLQKGLAGTSFTAETSVDVPGLGSIAVRSCAVNGVNAGGRVLLLRDVGPPPRRGGRVVHAGRR